jgi:hypothetical protein
MAIGPVQLVVLGFRHPNFHGEIIEELERLRESDTVRVIDSLVVYKDANGISSRSAWCRRRTRSNCTTSKRPLRHTRGDTRHRPLGGLRCSDPVGPAGARPAVPAGAGTNTRNAVRITGTPAPPWRAGRRTRSISRDRSSKSPIRARHDDAPCGGPGAVDSTTGLTAMAATAMSKALQASQGRVPSRRPQPQAGRPGVDDWIEGGGCRDDRGDA